MRASSLKRLHRIFLIGCIILAGFYLKLFVDLHAKVFDDPSIEATLDVPQNSAKSSKPVAPNTGLSTQSRRQQPETQNLTKITSNGNLTVTSRFSISKARLTSSVDYFACCGAGHRLSKLVDAHYLAKQLKFGLRVFFGFCEKQEVYSYFFGPQPLDELEQAAGRSAPGLFVKVSNDAPGFKRIRREGPNSTCQCPEDRLEEDAKFYTSLRDRFRAREKIEAFRQAYFTNHTVIGMHIRAGNGEKGDFINKNRTITDPKWAVAMADQLLELSTDWTEPPLLFIATDTSSMVTKFRSLLKDKMPVVEMDQGRLQAGMGVLFGQSGHLMTAGEACLAGWESAFTDMMLLSHADVVVAARPSSFTQSLPMSLVLSTPKLERKVIGSFCEVNPMATAVRCYEDSIDWCCKGNTSFSLQTIQNYDYRRMPDMDFLKSNKIFNDARLRPRDGRFCIPTPLNTRRECLPYDMPDKDRVEKAGRVVGLPLPKELQR
jgi:hypothetical protein